VELEPLQRRGVGGVVRRANDGARAIAQSDSSPPPPASPAAAPPAGPPAPPDMPSPLARYAAPVVVLLLVNITFSAYTTLAAAAFRGGTSPVVFAFLRDAVAVCCFVPALALSSRSSGGPWRPRAEHFSLFLLLAFLGVWGSQLMSALAIANLSPAIYGLLKPSVPAVTMFIAVMLGMQRFNIRARASQFKAAGVAAAVGGAVLIVVASGEDHESANAPLGSAYMLLQVACSASYPILQKHMLKTLDYPPLLLAAWAYILGTAMIGTSVVVAAADSASWQLSGAAVGGILFAGVLSSFANYSAMAWVNSVTSPVLVMSAYPLQSFLSPLFASIFLGEHIGAADYVGGTVIVVGLALCVYSTVLEAPDAAAAPKAAALLSPEEREQALPVAGGAAAVPAAADTAGSLHALALTLDAAPGAR
jgi:drug/metabolite transporter (DMT)-like permease